MPLYSYKCEKCDRVFDELLKMNDRNLPLESCCPNCNQEGGVILLITATAIVSPFSLDGLKKPQADFKERMKQIKHNVRHSATIKDY